MKYFVELRKSHSVKKASTPQNTSAVTRNHALKGIGRVENWMSRRAWEWRER